MPENSAVVALDFVAPCLPCVTMLPPSGGEWLHEIKHPGHRLIARRSDRVVRLFGGHGEDWTAAFPHLVDAFDVLDVNGFDLRRDRLEERKRVLSQILRKPPVGMRLNQHFDFCGEAIRRQIGRLGFEGVISKRRGSRYLSGRSPDWLFSRKLDERPL